jgi:hypothetical protein
VSANDEGDQVPATMPGESGELQAAMLLEGGQLSAGIFGEESGRARAAMLRAQQPAGAVFALGWVMAELFDPRRQVSVTVRQPPFDPDTQLPQVSDLAADPKLVFLAAELAEYLHWFPRLTGPLRLVTAQAHKKKAAVAAENLTTAEAADRAEQAHPVDQAARAQSAAPAEQAAAEPAGVPAAAGPADDVLAEAAAAVVAAESATGPTTPRTRAPRTTAPRTAAPEAAFSETRLLDAIAGLNQAILDEFADDPERLSAYQLGLALSDLVWLPTVAPGRQGAAGRPSTLFGLFARSQLANVQTLLSGAGTQLPTGTATIVSRSLDNWADWIDVNSMRIKAPAGDTWSTDGDVVVKALRVQGWVWHSVLIADPEVAVTPGMGAWVEAGSSIALAARMTSEVILRRFWPVLVIGLVALGGLLYLVISSLSGASQVWASLVTVAAVVGSGSWGLSSGVSSAFDGIGYEIWNAAKVDAAAWNITWLPALTTSTVERARLERRGVAMPQIRKSMDIS